MVGKVGYGVRRGKAALLLKGGLLPGANADTLLSPHRLERGRARGWRGQLDGGKKRAVCALGGEEESGEQTQEEGQAKRRRPL